MKRFAPIAILVLLLASMLAPPASGATIYTFAGKSSARALDLAIPALNVTPQTANQFKGLTIGATFAEFNSTPSIFGRAAARCELLASGAGATGSLPCTSSSLEESSAPDGNSGDSQNKCEASQSIVGVVNLNLACSNSFSAIDAGKLKGDNTAGVADVKLSLDLGPLNSAVEAQKDVVVDQLSGVVNQVFQMAKGTPAGGIEPQKQEALKDALGDFLESVKQGGQFGVIKAGLSSTQVLPKANGLTVSSQAAGSSIGLLGLTNALQDGLVIIEVSVAKASVDWNATSAVATGSATPAVATIKVKDLVDLVPGDYIVASITVPQLNSILSNLDGTILETTLTAADSSVSPPGLNVNASTSGVSLHAVKGLGATGASGTNPGNLDGGVVLRLAVANASFSAAPVEQAPPPLPITGGPIYLFLGAAAILAIGAPFMWRLSRKLYRAG